MNIGDRVEIVGRDHPWRGERGTIVAPFDLDGLDWTVQLDLTGISAHQTACATADLRVLSEASS
jgi:hypothetical protein